MYIAIEWLTDMTRLLRQFRAASGNSNVKLNFPKTESFFAAVSSASDRLSELDQLTHHVIKSDGQHKFLVMCSIVGASSRS